MKTKGNLWNKSKFITRDEKIPRITTKTWVNMFYRDGEEIL